MFDPDLTDQIKKLFFTQKINLSQFWALIVLAGQDKLAPPTAKPDYEELKRSRKSVELLEAALRLELLAKQVGSEDSETWLTPQGMELVSIAMRFFDEVNGLVIEHSDHGRTVCIGSSATLLHWLVLPQIGSIQSRTAAFETSRQPELSFSQIERDEVRDGLLTHGLHMAILREDTDLATDCVEAKTKRKGMEVLEDWARMSDDDFAQWFSKNGKALSDGQAHGYRRLSVPLGSYRYVMCMQPKSWELLKKEAKRTGQKWQSKINLALCTNHRSLRPRLMDLEKTGGFHVRLRTDTWVDSAQVAIHGGYATVLPSIADFAKTGLQIISPLEMLEPERVLLVFNPSILKVKLFREMLHAVGCTISHALACSCQAKDPPTK